MKRNRFTDEQIIGILKEHEAGTPVSELCRKHGVSDASIYKWKARHSTRDVMRCCAAEMAPHRNPPLPNQQQQPKTAGANSKLDKTWGQGHG
ncbi:transposase-like protein [Rhizobium ruizarguesonis]